MSDELNPQQISFLKYYTDPTSETFSDAKNSAIKAGYSEEYAENITHLMPDWLSESIGRRKRMLVKAEKNLEDVLDLGVSDKTVLSEVMKASVFIAKTQAKNEGYSERTEMEHSGEINVNHIDDEQAIKILKRRGLSVPDISQE